MEQGDDLELLFVILGLLGDEFEALVDEGALDGGALIGGGNVRVELGGDCGVGLEEASRLVEQRVKEGEGRVCVHPLAII